MIVITTPSGLIGHQVLENMLDGEEALRVIARDPSLLTADARQRVEVIEGSHADGAVVDKALAGAAAVFWLTPPDPRATSVEAAYVGFAWPAAEAFKRHGVERVVGVSALGRGTPWAAQAGYVTGSLAVDDLIAGFRQWCEEVLKPAMVDPTETVAS
jgi:nucleoside-diphosphate-sugar epimerase